MRVNHTELVMSNHRQRDEVPGAAASGCVVDGQRVFMSAGIDR